MRLAFDIETNDLLDKVTTLHSLCIRDLDSDKSWSLDPQWMPAGLLILSKATLLVGHNIQTFDLPALKKITGWEPPRGCLIRDTLTMSRLMFPDIETTDMARLKTNPQYLPGKLIGKHSLEAWGYRLGDYKGDFHGPWDKWTPEMQAYCEQDVVVTEKLFRRLEGMQYAEEAVQLEHDVVDIIFQQVQHGCRFAKDGAVSLYSSLVKRRDEIVEECRKVFPPYVETLKTPAYYVDPFGGQWPTKKAAKEAGHKNVTPGPLRTKTELFNPGSRPWVAEELQKLGWVPVQFTPTGQPQLDDGILEAAAKELQRPEARLIAEFYLVQKRCGQISEGKKAWLQFEKNGRIHGQVVTNGAVTGRATHHSPNLSQVPSVVVGKDKKPLLGAAGFYGYECRSCFVPDPGYVMVGWDASGVQLRGLAHYMARYDGGEYVKVVTTGDVHSTNQAAAGLATRDQAKTFIYSYLFGCGDAKSGKQVGVKPEEIPELKKDRGRWSYAVRRFNKMGVKYTELDVATVVKGGQVKARFEKETPALASLKNDILLKITTHNGRYRRIRPDASLKGLDGRLLHIRSAHAALNTLLQSFEAILVKKALVILYKKLTNLGWKFGKEYAFLIWNHDEEQAQVLPNLAQQYGELAVQSLKEAGEAFGSRCPISGEFKIGDSWASTH